MNKREEKTRRIAYIQLRLESRTYTTQKTSGHYLDGIDILDIHKLDMGLHPYDKPEGANTIILPTTTASRIGKDKDHDTFINEHGLKQK